MGKRIDLKGQRFGRLTVLKYAGNSNCNHAMWECICDCGKKKVILGNALRIKRTQSCGCLAIERAKAACYKHGHTSSKNKDKRTRLYTIWQNMRSRCEKEYGNGYQNYGARGIKVCPEWSDFVKFEEWSKESGYKDDLTIERINVDLDYCPANCKWITKKEQGFNKRNNRLIEFEGVTKTVGEWSEEKGIKYGTLWNRLERGKMSVDEMLNKK